jgi:16S rRNA (guanine527-N7)-methyltransferase
MWWSPPVTDQTMGHDAGQPEMQSEKPAAEAQMPPALTGELLAAAEELFGDRVDLAVRFVGHLSSTGIEWGLLGPREVPRLWERHVLNCAVVGDLLPDGALVADVGSGAGLPGLALALARPDCQFILIEPLERRVAWLDMVVQDLGLDNVDVVRSRSEQVVGNIVVDVVTARAVSALKTLLPLTIPLLQGSGELIAIKGRSAANEVTAAAKVLKKLKCSTPVIETVGEDLLSEPTTVVRVSVGPRR